MSHGTCKQIWYRESWTILLKYTIETKQGGIAISYYLTYRQGHIQLLICICLLERAHFSYLECIICHNIIHAMYNNKLSLRPRTKMIGRKHIVQRTVFETYSWTCFPWDWENMPCSLITCHLLLEPQGTIGPAKREEFPWNDAIMIVLICVVHSDFLWHWLVTGYYSQLDAWEYRSNGIFLTDQIFLLHLCSCDDIFFFIFTCVAARIILIWLNMIMHRLYAQIYSIIWCHVMACHIMHHIIS